jgi:hypothetical protein
VQGGSVSDPIQVYFQDRFLYRQNELGSDLIDFLLNTSTNSPTYSTLGDTQRHAFQVFEQNLLQVSGSFSSMSMDFLLSEFLSRFHESLDCSLPVYLHGLCGGDISLPDTNNDRELGWFLRVARDHFACLLVPESHRWSPFPRRLSTFGRYRHPDLLRLEAAIMAGESPFSKRFFSSSDEAETPLDHLDLVHDQRAYARHSFGGVGGMQLSLLADSILNDTIHRDNEGLTSLQSWLLAAKSAFLCARELFNTGEAEVPFRLFLGNLSSDQYADNWNLGKGVVRTASAIEQQLVGVRHATSAVWETTMRVKVDWYETQLDWENAANESRPDHDSTYKFVDQCRIEVPLSLLVANSYEDGFAIPIVSAVVVLPGLGDMTSTSAESGYACFVTKNLTEEAVKNADRLFQTFSTMSDQMLEGCRRLVLAATNRSDSRDRFLDAISCLEALFGGNNDTTFRISACVAKVLGGDDPKREENYRSFKRLYGLRSHLVHMNPSGLNRETWLPSQNAIGIAIRIIRILLEEHPELSNIKESENRSRLILLSSS